MSVVPTGILSAPLAALRDMVAASTDFQAWAQAADATEAADHVHLLVAPANAPTPYVLIDFGTLVRERSAIANRTPFQTISTSDLVVWIHADAATDDEPDATLDFCNHVGALWAHLENIAGIHQDTRLALNRIELINPPTRVEEENRDTAGDYFECALSASYTRLP
jgi:hypothetical protein